jgi:hypothetical protein
MCWVRAQRLVTPHSGRPPASTRITGRRSVITRTPRHEMRHRVIDHREIYRHQKGDRPSKGRRTAAGRHDEPTRAAPRASGDEPSPHIRYRIFLLALAFGRACLYVSWSLSMRSRSALPARKKGEVFSPTATASPFRFLLNLRARAGLAFGRGFAIDYP